MIQLGHGTLPVFMGARRQRGHGLNVNTVKNIFKSVTKKVPVKAIGKQLVKSGVSMAQDMMAGESFADAARHQGEAVLNQMLKPKKRQPPLKAWEKGALQQRGNKWLQPPGERAVRTRPHPRKGIKRRASSSSVSLRKSKRARRPPDFFDA